MELIYCVMNFLKYQKLQLFYKFFQGLKIIMFLN